MGKMALRKIFRRFLHAKRLVKFQLSCKFIPNWTWNCRITYTNTMELRFQTPPFWTALAVRSLYFDKAFSSNWHALLILKLGNYFTQPGDYYVIMTSSSQALFLLLEGFTMKPFQAHGTVLLLVLLLSDGIQCRPTQGKSSAADNIAKSRHFITAIFSQWKWMHPKPQQKSVNVVLNPSETAAYKFNVLMKMPN